MDFALFVNSRVVCAEINIADIAVATAPEGERPPALITNLKPRNVEAVYVTEVEKVIIPDGRKSVFILRSFGKSVVFLVSVKDCEAFALDGYIFAGACKGISAFGIKVFALKNVRINARCNAKMSIFKHDANI